MGPRGTHLAHGHRRIPGRLRDSIDAAKGATGMDLVVIGLGYVGLPLAREAARAGLRTGGLDRDARVGAGLKAGLSHIDDVSPAEIEGMRGAGVVPSLAAG